MKTVTLFCLFAALLAVIAKPQPSKPSALQNGIVKAIHRYVRSTPEEQAQHLGIFADALDSFADITENAPSKFNLNEFARFLPNYLKTRAWKDSNNLVQSTEDAERFFFYSDSSSSSSSDSSKSNSTSVASNSTSSSSSSSSSSSDSGDYFDIFHDSDSSSSSSSSSSSDRRRRRDLTPKRRNPNNVVRKRSIQQADELAEITNLRQGNAVWGPMNIKHLATYIRSLDPTELEQFLNTFVDLLQRY